MAEHQEHERFGMPEAGGVLDQPAEWLALQNTLHDAKDWVEAQRRLRQNLLSAQSAVNADQPRQEDQEAFEKADAAYQRLTEDLTKKKKRLREEWARWRIVTN